MVEWKMDHALSAVSIIENCMPILESYTDFESIKSLTQTCHTIHNILVDATTGKMKVSHFEVENFPVPHPSTQEPHTIIQNWCTAPARIPHFVTQALNTIHFPTLRCLHIDFPLTRRRNLNVIEDVSCAAFPVFVTNLGYASHLEFLHIDVGRLITTERTGQIEAMYELLSLNLQKCNNLCGLSVRNIGVDHNGSCLWSLALMRALIPSMTKRHVDLKSFKICISGTASDPVYSQQLLNRGVDVLFDFFAAVFSLKSLYELEIEFSLDHLDALIRAGNRNNHFEIPSGLKDLKLAQHPSTGEANEYPSAVNLLDHFSECHLLKSLYLDLSINQWQDCHLALKRLIYNKPTIESLSLCFSCYCDDGGRMMKALVEFSSQECLASLRELSIFGLFNANAQDFELVQNMLTEKKLYMSRCRKKPCESNSSEFDLIICRFEKRASIS